MNQISDIADLDNIDMSSWLQERLGPVHVRQRLALEDANEHGKPKSLRDKLSLWYIVDEGVPLALRLSRLLPIGQSNAVQFQVSRNDVKIRNLPVEFEGFTILHISDFHADISVNAMRKLPDVISQLNFDICVITGDFRGLTHGPYEPSLAITLEALKDVKVPIFGILGNHDTVGIIQGLERGGIVMLMNESHVVTRNGKRIYLAGVDDPVYYRTNNLQKALGLVPDDEPTILLSHSANEYRQAAAANVDLFLCGHTHGGQMCLPGSLPVLTASNLPRKFVAGSWSYRGMQGYTSRGVGTSAVDARFYCPPEVTLHRLLAC